MRRLSAAIAASCLCLGMLAGEAEATLIGQAVTVTLGDGGSHHYDDVVVVVGGVAELAAGDGSEIGTILLPSESVDIRSSSIVLTLEEGVPDGGTGYPTGMAYLFSNLALFGQDTAITGVSLTVSNIAGIAIGDITFTATTLRVPVDALVIGEIAGVDVGTLHLDLTFMVIPEPGTALLASLGLAALACRARAARRAAA